MYIISKNNKFSSSFYFLIFFKRDISIHFLTAKRII